MKKIALSIFCSLIIALGGFYFAVVKPVLANVTCSLPFTLTNGTIADATQVMANYNALVTCFTNAAAAGANNDITSLSGLTTPITPGEGGSNVYIGSAPTASGADLTIATTSPTNYANTRGYTVIFTAVATNTSVQTLSVNGQTKKNIFKQSTAGPVALSGGEIVPNQQYLATYDGTQFQINPVPSIAVGWGLQAQTATLTGINLTNPPYGFNSCINMTLSATVGSGLLGVQLFAADTGTAPTAQHPILCPFRDSTVANGGPIWVSITSAVYLDTNAIGATFGTTTNQAFRLWLTAFNNGGTPVLSLWQAVATPTNINALNEGTVQSTTGVSNASTSAGVFYTPNGTNLSSKAFRILGYMDWSSGLATVGNYSAQPTVIQLFGPGVRKPGEVIQRLMTSATTVVTSNSTTFSTTTSNLALGITPSAAPSVVRYFISDSGNGSNTSSIGAIRMIRGGTALPFAASFSESGTAGGNTFPITLQGFDIPTTVASVTYTVAHASVGGSGQTISWCNTTNQVTAGSCSLSLEEISP